jgi:apolipoprotein N-acyltransferase
MTSCSPELSPESKSLATVPAALLTAPRRDPNRHLHNPSVSNWGLRTWDAIQHASLPLLAAALNGLPWLYDGLFWCSWLGIALGLVVVTRASWVASWWMTWLWGTLAISIAFHWSPAAMAYTLSSSYGLGLAVAFPFLAWDGLRMAASFWLAARTTRDLRWIWIPAALWAITLEWAMPSVFPWRLGLPQLAVPWLVQPVDIFGGGWTTLMAFAHAGLLIQLLCLFSRQPGRQPTTASTTSPFLSEPARVAHSLWLASFLVIFNASYGVWALATWNHRTEAARHVRFGVVQVDPSYTWSTDHLRQLSEQVAHQVDIVCWPESSGGNYELTLTDLSDANQVFAHSRKPERGLQPWPTPRCELLLGGKCYQGDPESPELLHVTAMLIDEQQHINARYHKRFLMPFGEYVPFEKTVPGMQELFDMAEHVQPGATPKPISSQTGARMGVMLCYEDMVPRAAYEPVRQGANVLVSLANGSAFESPYTLTQHRLLSQLRAIECRKSFVRCAATGQSCVISPVGKIEQRLALQQDGALVANVSLLEGQTFFTRAPWLGTALSLLGLVATTVLLRRHPLDN